MTRFEKPHSLSYQATTLTWRPSTRVRAESKIDEAGLPTMSVDTSGSSEYSRTPASGPSAAARYAATRATPEQCGVLTKAVMDMAVHGRAGDLRPYLEADILFHRTLLEASGNEMLAALADVVAG